jgi:hypothetical protein
LLGLQVEDNQKSSESNETIPESGGAANNEGSGSPESSTDSLNAESTDGMGTGTNGGTDAESTDGTDIELGMNDIEDNINNIDISIELPIPVYPNPVYSNPVYSNPVDPIPLISSYQGLSDNGNITIEVIRNSFDDDGHDYAQIKFSFGNGTNVTVESDADKTIVALDALSPEFKEVFLVYGQDAINTSESMLFKTGSNSAFKHLNYGTWLNENTEQSFVFYSSDDYVDAVDLPTSGTVNFSGTAVFNWYQGATLLVSGTEHDMDLSADFLSDSVAIQFGANSYTDGIHVNPYINPYDGTPYNDGVVDTSSLNIKSQSISIDRANGGFSGTFLSAPGCAGCEEPLPPEFYFYGTINGDFTGSGQAEPQGAVGLINISNGDISVKGSLGTIKQNRGKIKRMGFKKALLVAALMTVSAKVIAEESATKQTVEITTEQAYSIMFKAAMSEAKKGNYEKAEKLLNAIWVKTKAPRVGLELGKVRYHQGKYSESKEVFTEVLSGSTLAEPVPWEVRKKVHVYLSDIDMRLGSIMYSVELVSDSNPTNFTSSETVEILGSEFVIQKPDVAETVNGVRANATMNKSLDKKKSLVAHAGVSLTKYEMDELDRALLNLGVSYQSPQSKVKYKAGVVESFLAGEHEYQLGYVGLSYYPQLSFNSSIDVQVSDLDVIVSDNYDAKIYSVSFSGGKRLTKDSALSGSIKLEKSNAKLEENSFNGIGTNLTLSHHIGRGWSADTTMGAQLRQYQDESLFFGSVREDRKLSMSVSFYNRDFRIFDMIPKIGVSHENNESNLDYYTYDKTNLIAKVEF